MDVQTFVRWILDMLYESAQLYLQQSYTALNVISTRLYTTYFPFLPYISRIVDIILMNMKKIEGM